MAPARKVRKGKRLVRLDIGSQGASRRAYLPRGRVVGHPAGDAGDVVQPRQRRLEAGEACACACSEDGGGWGAWR